MNLISIKNLSINFKDDKNVVNNIEALETHVYSITNKNSIRKVRYVDNKSNQLVLRVDEHDYCESINKDFLNIEKDIYDNIGKSH